MVTIYAAYLYDAVLLYANAVKALLTERSNLTVEELDDIIGNGSAIIGKIIDNENYKSEWREHYDQRYAISSDSNLFFVFLAAGITGQTIRIDDNGDSEGNFTVLIAKRVNSSEESRLKCPYVMRLGGMFYYGHNGPVSVLRFHNPTVK